MPEADPPTGTADAPPGREHPRRRFLLAAAAAVYGAVAAALAATAFRFLRPQQSAAGPTQWLAAGRVSELGSGEPVRRAVTVERRAGWSVARREVTVFVLTGGERRVVSAVCPHEGCEVDWDAGERAFLCPCHDSRFDAEGKRLTGPAERDLAQLPARVNGDLLEVRFTPEGERGARQG